jgi:hypothetical protein
MDIGPKDNGHIQRDSTSLTGVRGQGAGKMLGDDINLDQSADVFWLPLGGAERPKGLIGCGEQRHFPSLRDAIVFTMDTLPPRERATAWISLLTGPLKIEEIEVLHRRLKPRESDSLKFDVNQKL